MSSDALDITLESDLKKLVEQLDVESFYANYSHDLATYGLRKRNKWFGQSNKERVANNQIDGYSIEETMMRLQRYDEANSFVRFFQRLFTSIEKQRSLLCYWAIESLQPQQPVSALSIPESIQSVEPIQATTPISFGSQQAPEAIGVLRLHIPHLKSSVLRNPLSTWDLSLKTLLPSIVNIWAQLRTLWNKTKSPISTAIITSPQQPNFQTNSQFNILLAKVSTIPTQSPLSKEEAIATASLDANAKTENAWRLQWQADMDGLAQQQTKLKKQIQSLVLQNKKEDAKKALEDGLKPINQTYRKLFLIYHPDRWTEETVSGLDYDASKALATELFKGLNEQKDNFIKSLENLFDTKYGPSSFVNDPEWMQLFREKMEALDQSFKVLDEAIIKLQESNLKTMEAIKNTQMLMQQAKEAQANTELSIRGCKEFLAKSAEECNALLEKTRLTCEQVTVTLHR